MVGERKEWRLQDGILKSVKENGQEVFRLQFNWEFKTGRARGLSQKPYQYRRRQCRPYLTKSNDGVKEDNVYEMDCILARWGKNRFFLKWTDGSSLWKPRANLDKEDVQNFDV
ncbi:hypothetical protein BX600DRAFT_83041 [Xylariales sp. PMI_506]|nr:hypothetical protein BX600DRAFT_83041 [Xylariales sp. PMI_506]